MTNESEYNAWLNERRTVRPPDDLADRIMTQVHEAASANPPETSVPEPMRTARAWPLGPALFWTVASLIFAIRIAALVGNLAFPTSSYPEFAGDQQIEELPHESRSTSRS